MPARTRLAACIASALLVGGLVAPSTARAQGAGPTLLGGMGGLFAGGLVSVGIWTAEARFAGEYLYDVDEALSWQGAPILVGLGVGVTLGVSDRDRLYAAGRGAAVGGAGGAAVGALLGTLFWEDPERGWAGGVIGAGAGVLLGSVIGALTADIDDADVFGTESTAGAVPFAVRIPVGF